MPSRFPIPFSSSRTFDPLFELHREMNRLFDDVLTGAPATGGSRGAGLVSMPRIDVRENDRELCVLAELPGVKPSEVELRVDGDMLTISGEKKLESEREQENVHVMERGYGRFHRMVQLPFAPNPDEVRAECDHGVLTIHVPKSAQQEKSRRIEVRGGAEQGGTQVQGQKPEEPLKH